MRWLELLSIDVAGISVVDDVTYRWFGLPSLQPRKRPVAGMTELLIGRPRGSGVLAFRCSSGGAQDNSASSR